MGRQVKLQQAYPVNEAAERLRRVLDDMGYSRHNNLLEVALATADRLAVQRTVEQIGDAITRLTEETLSPPTLAEIRAILDVIADE